MAFAQHRLGRRRLLGAATIAGLGWLTPVAEVLARRAERIPREPAQSVILLWLAGGPSQLETFDPHPGATISGGTRAIDTTLPGIQLAAGFEQVAEEMDEISLVRSLVSKEGDHERGTYLVKTGYRPDPTLVHPSIGAICCHQLPVGRVEIPRHVSILPRPMAGARRLPGKSIRRVQDARPGPAVPDVTSQVSWGTARGASA